MTEDPQKLLQKIYTEQQMTESNLNLLQQRIEPCVSEELMAHCSDSLSFRFSLQNRE